MLNGRLQASDIEQGLYVLEAMFYCH